MKRIKPFKERRDSEENILEECGKDEDISPYLAWAN
jgi:hypothetical protein